MAMDPDEYRQDVSAAMSAVWNDLEAETTAARDRLGKLPIEVRATLRAFYLNAEYSLLVEPIIGRLQFSKGTINNFVLAIWRDPAAVLRAIRRMESAVRWVRRVVKASEGDWQVYVEHHANALREIKAQAAKGALQGE